MSTERAALLKYPEPVVWTAVLIGIPAWIAHLTFEAAMVRFTAVHPGWHWTLHAATVVTALVTVGGMALCYDLVRTADRVAAGHVDDDLTSPATLSRFLGVLGLLVGAANLALILLEGSYVVLVHNHG